MDNSSLKNSFTQLQKIIFAISAIALAAVLLIFRTDFSTTRSLDQLARKSLAPEVALSNNKPTIFEFYADWCEVCKEMAPSMINAEEINKDKIDIVFLNVDNEKWLDLLSLYGVSGIPQMNFFDEFGNLKGKSIGLRSFEEIMDISNALINGNELPDFNGLDDITYEDSPRSLIDQTSKSKIVKPRSHG